MEVQQIIDGEGIEIPSGETYRFMCCSCGLVHDMVLISQDGKPIGWAMRQNQEATKESRERKERSKNEW